jgi:hypothetical protein
MMSGADLMGGGMVTPTQAPGGPGGPSGADLARGPMGPEQGMEQPADAEVDQAIRDVLALAQSQGWQPPQGNVPPDQVPQLYQQMLAAAARAPEAQTDGGIAMIERLAQTLGVPSPYGQGEPGAQDYVFGGEQPAPMGGMGGRGMGQMDPGRYRPE